MREVQKKPRPAPTDFVSDLERLDALTHSIYDCTFDEYGFRLYSHAYDDGFQKGKKEGYSAGRRAAKGLGPAKARGHPLEINKGLRALMQSEVDRRMSGTTVDQAIKKFLKAMQLGRKAVGETEGLPSIKKAKAAYYRDRKRKVPISSF
jgi:hypothetical protein